MAYNHDETEDLLNTYGNSYDYNGIPPRSESQREYNHRRHNERFITREELVREVQEATNPLLSRVMELTQVISTLTQSIRITTPSSSRQHVPSHNEEENENLCPQTQVNTHSDSY